jgi:hypothetical protein
MGLFYSNFLMFFAEKYICVVVGDWGTDNITPPILSDLIAIF